MKDLNKCNIRMSYYKLHIFAYINFKINTQNIELLKNYYSYKINIYDYVYFVFDKIETNYKL